MKAYLDIIREVQKYGEWSDNRTGVRTKKLSGTMFKHDMREGFPLLTTKKVNLKTVFTEDEFFIKGMTDKQWLKDRGVNIWNQWCNPEKVPYGNDEETQKKMVEENDLGEIYGYIWNNWECEDTVVKVERIIKEKELPIEYPIFYPKQIETKNDHLIGKIFDSNNYGSYNIISLGEKTNRGQTYNIQFLRTGFIKYNVRIDVINNGSVKDLFLPSVSGVGFIGDYKIESDIDKNLYKIWSHIIERCYNPNCKEYKYYGERGIFVSNDWLNFSIFVKEVKQIQGWVKKQRYLNDMYIDKDFYGSNCYSKETCVWLTKKHNILYRSAKLFKVIHPDGKTSYEISKTDCAKKHDLLSDKICMVLNNQRPHHKNYRFEYVEHDDKFVYRYPLPINQLKNAVHKLKTNPTDRRIIVNAWRPDALSRQALPPCHIMFQLLSNGKDLDLLWYQRSCDLFLGVPFNIASYGLLLELIAKTVGMVPRRLIGFLADTHIYENHQEQIEEQLSREPKTLPTLVLPDNTDIFTWESDQYELEGYDPAPFIKADIAI